MKHISFFVILAVTILTLNLIPLIIHIYHAPSDRTFSLIHNNAQDFYFYQSLMNEGAQGAWLTTDPYTTESHTPSIIFSYFLWLGKLGSVLGISHAFMYHLVRIILSLLFLLITYHLLLFIKIPYPRLAFFFFLFAQPFMHGSQPYMYWWTGMDAIRRVAYLPHHMAGNLLLTLLVIFLLRFWETRKKKFFIISLFISFALAFIHPPSLLIILLILPPSVLIYFSMHRFEIHQFSWLLVYWITGLLVLLFMYLQSGKGFPWSQYIDWEKNLQFPLGRELIGAFGILFPFAVLGATRAFLSKRFDYMFVAFWFFLPILFVPLAPYLSISNIRLVQGAPFVPMAILAVLGIKSLINFIHLKTNECTGLLGYWVIGLLFIVFTFPTLSWSLQDQIREFSPIYSNIYLEKKLFPAFRFINQMVKPKTKTIAAFYTGNYLPVFTHTVSFAGHFGYTYNVERKQSEIEKFFKNAMTPQEAKELLVNNGIDLIFQGPEEKPLSNTYLYPEILKVIYDKEGITMYRLI